MLKIIIGMCIGMLLIIGGLFFDTLYSQSEYDKYSDTIVKTLEVSKDYQFRSDDTTFKLFYLYPEYRYKNRRLEICTPTLLLKSEWWEVHSDGDAENLEEVFVLLENVWMSKPVTPELTNLYRQILKEKAQFIEANVDAVINKALNASNEKSIKTQKLADFTEDRVNAMQAEK